MWFYMCDFIIAIRFWGRYGDYFFARLIATKLHILTFKALTDIICNNVANKTS